MLALLDHRWLPWVERELALLNLRYTPHIYYALYGLLGLHWFLHATSTLSALSASLRHGVFMMLKAGALVVAGLRLQFTKVGQLSCVMMSICIRYNI